MRKVSSFAQVMDTARMSPLHWKVFIFAALGIFMDGYDFFIVAAALPLIEVYWHPAPALLGAIGAAATVGAVLGGSLLGRLGDVWGRRTMAMLTMLLFAAISFASAFAWSIVALIGMRFALGVAIGADYPTGASYVAEFMPIRARSQLLFASLSFQAVGAVVGALIGVHLVHWHAIEVWRLMLALGVVPALVILALRRQLPDSPRWLYAAGKIERAKAVLEQLLQEPVELAISDEPGVAALPFRALFSRQFIGRTLFATVPWTCMDIALYGMGIFTPMILAQAGFAHAKPTFWSRDIHALRGTLDLDLLLVVGFALGILAVRRLGPVRMQIAGFAGMLAGLVTAAFGSALHQNGLLFAGFAVFNLCVDAGPNGTTYIIAAVEFPTSIRASGAGLGAAAGKVGASLGIFLLPVLQASIGLSATVGVVAAITALGLVVSIALRGELYAGAHLQLRGEAPLAVPSSGAALG